VRKGLAKQPWAKRVVGLTGAHFGVVFVGVLSSSSSACLWRSAEFTEELFHVGSTGWC
jgi:hypothetical protein